MPYLVLLNEDKTTTTIKITKPCTTLGSKPDNDLVASMKGVSRHHAHIVKKEAIYLLEDLDSTNFVFVDNQRVDKFSLKDNTRFSLGDHAKILFLDDLDEAKVHRFVSDFVVKEPEEHKDTTRIIHRSLPKTVKELETLIELQAQLCSVLELEKVLESLIDKTIQTLGAERGFIMLLEKDTLIPKVARNMATNLIDDERLAFSRSFAQKVIEKKDTLISTNVAEDPRYKSESIISHRILSIICSPLKLGDEVLGVLYADIRESARYFSDKDAAFLSALANVAAVAIQNARLTEDLRKQQVFLEQTNAQLQKSLEKVIETNLKLEQQRRELTVLFDVSRSLNMAADVDSILRLILRKTREVLDAERGSLMIYDEKLEGLVVKLVDGAEVLPGPRVVLKPGQGIAGTVAKTGKGMVVNDANKDGRFARVLDRDRDIRQLICVPLISNDTCLGVINLVNNRRSREFTPDDLSLVTSIANLAAVSIEKFRLYREKLQQEKLNLEIEDAQKVQQLLLPRSLPFFKSFEFSAKYALANRVGGDYYDFIPLDAHRLAVVIADVSGHDIASALVMAMGRNLIRTLFTMYDSPAKVLAHTSRVLRQDTQSSRYITMFLAILDARDQSLVYCNAGHNYPLYLRADQKEFSSLSVGGFPLGLVDDYTYNEESLKLAPGDLLVLYTDGLIEAQNPSGEMFDLKRLEQMVKEGKTRPIDELATEIYERALEFAQSEKLQDDFTFVAVRAKDPAREMHLEFVSGLDEITPQVGKLTDFCQGAGFFTADKFNLVLVLKELVTNAIEHGNKCDRAKRVRVSAIPSHRSLTVICRDEGEGFNFSRVLAANKKDIFRDRGRGLILISEYADKVEFNEKGNEVRVTFLRPGEKPAKPA